MRRPPALPLLAVLVSFAGCAGSEGIGEAAPSASFDVGEDAGVIEGRVVDDSVNPIANAQVQVKDTPLVALTDAAGGFVLQPVPLGTQTVFVVALGYDSVAKVVDVQSGGTTSVTVTLVALPVRAPFHETFGPEKGYFECRLGTPSQTGECGWVSQANSVTGHPTQFYPNDKSIFSWNLANNDVVTVIGDMRWTPGSFATSTAMRFAFSYDKRDPSHRWCGWEGPTPLQFRFEQQLGGEYDAEGSKCSSDQNFEDVGPPTTDLNPMRSYTNVPFGGTTSPFYLALQQSYEVITTAFYVEKAPDPYNGFPDQ